MRSGVSVSLWFRTCLVVVGLQGAWAIQVPVLAEAQLLCPRPLGSTCFRYPLAAPPIPEERIERPDVHLQVFNTTYVYNIESQGTFITRRKACQGSFCFRNEEEVNGFTLFGDFTGVQLRYSPTAHLNLYGGVFLAIPFGGERTIDLVRPIITLDYRLMEGVNFLAGTLQPRHPFHDAVFDDLMYFVRPVEQGFQFIANTRFYQQDFFINWQQQNTRLRNERFDIGYVGKVMFGPLRLNGQVHYDHLGGEVPFPDFRPIEARNNLVWAGGPELAFSPATYVPALALWQEVGIALTFFGDKDQPNTRAPELATQGHAHEVRGWVEIAGWRLLMARWHADNFVTSNGDRFFGVSDMTEIQISKLFPLYRDISLEFGGWLRFIDQKSVVEDLTSIPADARQTTNFPANIFYFAVHWNMDLDLKPLFKRPI
jgi:hypothetical protein